MKAEGVSRNTGAWPLFCNLLALLWIAGGMLFFFVRFTLVFYRANEAAMARLFERLSG